jgi:CRP/FNR family transcriptional regulator, cyclic AMP receptor protein
LIDHRRLTGVNTVTESVALSPLIGKGSHAPHQAVRSTNDAIVAFSNRHYCCRIIDGVVISSLEHLARFYWPWNAGMTNCTKGRTYATPARDAMQKVEPTLWSRNRYPQKRLAQSGAGRNTRDYESNENIFVQGEVADSVLFIQQGRVKVTVTSVHGKDAVVGILTEGQFFGESCLHGQLLRTATSKALCHCRITSITKAAMLSAIRDQPTFSKLFMDHLLSRNGRIEEDLVDQLFNSSEKRLARLLLLLANYGKEGSPPVASVTLSQETLAEMIGTTRSRVSFFMNKFRKLGFIDYNGTIHVHQSLLNAVLHDKPEIERHSDMQELVEI